MWLNISNKLSLNKLTLMKNELKQPNHVFILILFTFYPVCWRHDCQPRLERKRREPAKNNEALWRHFRFGDIVEAGSWRHRIARTGELRSQSVLGPDEPIGSVHSSRGLLSANRVQALVRGKEVPAF